MAVRKDHLIFSVTFEKQPAFRIGTGNFIIFFKK
ncbi:hypothetical protein PBAL39_19654 [Pedobacter sp. BAL39]|nr:hypothetical protein PBAL39_19654 [Pedobacter sp. BAL39]